MTPQAVLLRIHERGVTIDLNGAGGLRLSPSAKVTSGMTAAVRAHKGQLMALLTGLRACGAENDPIILEALALFNAMPSDSAIPHRVPLRAPSVPAIAPEHPEATQGWLLNVKSQ